MNFRGFRSIGEYESECARFGYTTRRVPFHGPEGACFVLLTAPPGHPTGSSVQAWTLFSADETKELLDGVVSGGMFFKAHAHEGGPGYIRDGLDVNFLGKLYSHGYYPDNFEDVRAIAQGEPISTDHPIYDRYPEKKREIEKQNNEKGDLTMKKYYGSYTTEAAKALKGYNRLVCQIAEDGTIYICNGYLIFSLTGDEYDAVARPVAQCDAGNWTMDKDGKHDGADVDLHKLFSDAVQAVKDAAPLRRSALLVDAGKGHVAACYYSYGQSYDQAFAQFIDRRYTAALADHAVLRSVGSVSAAVAFADDLPFAMILPIKPDPKNVRAVEAYFGANQSVVIKDQRIDQLRDQNADLCNQFSAKDEELTQAQNEVKLLKAQIAQQADAMRAQLAQNSKLEDQLSALREQLAQQVAEPATVESKPEPKTTAELIAARWSQVYGLTATVKGAQTAAPVVWLDGDAQPHAKEIEAEGGKWSNKRNAYYFRVA
jgi:hypothetical protein